ncbi:MAG TPA: hypothetical protein VGB77_18850 [Abditibacteriaceae bacterium]
MKALVAALLLCALAVSCIAQPVIIDPDIVTDNLTNQTPEERDRKAWEKLRAENKETETANPQAAVKAYQAFYEAKPKLAAPLAISLTRTVARLYADNLKDQNKAQELLLWGWDKYKTSPESGELLADQLKLLNEQKQYSKSIELLAAQWKDLRRSYTHFAVPALEEGVKAIKAQDKTPEQKAEQLSDLVMQAFLEFPYLVGGQVQFWDGKFYDPLMQILLDAKRYDEALSWAKLRFIAAPYEADAIDRASRMLVKVWSAKDPEKRQLDEFAKAQKDVTIVNPLSAVSLPLVNADLITERLARLDKSSAGAPERTTLLLWQGESKQAMREAKKWLELRGAEKTGALEACRVFKAADLNLLRATQFLTWLKAKEGPSPVDEFLKMEAKP